MFWRDVPWYGVLFFTFDYVTKLLLKEDDSKLMVFLKKSFACGIAGVVNWLPSYPIDVVKSMAQTHTGETPLRIREIVSKGYK